MPNPRPRFAPGGEPPAASRPPLTEQQQPVRLLVLPLLRLQRLVDALAPLLVRPLLGHQVLPQPVPHLRVAVLRCHRGGVRLAPAAVRHRGARRGQAGAQAVAQPHAAGAAASRPPLPHALRRAGAGPGRAGRGGARRALKRPRGAGAAERRARPSPPLGGRAPARDAAMATIL